MGLALGRKGKYGQAVDELKKAIDLNGDLKQAKQQLERFEAIQETASESLAQQKAAAGKRPASARPRVPATTATQPETVRPKRVKIAGKTIALAENGQFKSTMTRRKLVRPEGGPADKAERRAESEHVRAAGESVGGVQGGQGQGGAGGGGGFGAGKKIARDAREGKPGGPMKVGTWTGPSRTPLVMDSTLAGYARTKPTSRKTFLEAFSKSQKKGTGKVMLASVLGGKAQGALPITLEFPSAGTVPYAFEKAFLGDRQAELTIRCVRVGAALTLQGSIFVILAAVLVGVGLKTPRSALAASCIFAGLCVSLSRFATPAIRPYYQCAIAATVLAAVVVVVQMGVAWRRRS